VVGFFEHGDARSVSIKKSCYSYNKLSNYQLFIEYSAPWSKYFIRKIYRSNINVTVKVIFSLISNLITIKNEK